MKCSDCKDTGVYVGLFTTEPCRTCAVPPAATATTTDAEAWSHWLSAAKRAVGIQPWRIPLPEGWAWHGFDGVRRDPGTYVGLLNDGTWSPSSDKYPHIAAALADLWGWPPPGALR